MPFYDYDCLECDEVTEVFQRHFRVEEIRCICGAIMKRKEVNRFNFAMKIYHLTKMPYMGENYSEYEF